MKKLFGFMVVLLALFLSSNGFAQNVDSFVDVFDKLAKDKGISMPTDLEKKAFEFVPIVKKGQPVTFKMGGVKHDDEKPAHDVTLTEPFEMQKTEITQLQWVLVSGSNPSYFREGGTKVSIDGKDVSILYNRPVESVSYNNIQAFIKKLNELDKKYKYSLPTEAQWEYAVRAGTTTEYFFGDDASKLKDYSWYDSNSGGRTHDVAMAPNPKINPENKFGLYDMAGNVWERVSDYYDKNYYSYFIKNFDKITDPKGPDKGSGRVIRGGGWLSNDDECRSADRINSGSGYRHRYRYVGFRLVRDNKITL